MPRYSNILEAKLMRTKVIDQIGQALFYLDPTRLVRRSYKDLPAVGTPFVLIETQPTSKDGIGAYGREIYLSDVDEYTEDTVISQTATFRITAASSSPYDFLNDFVISRETEDWWRIFFSDQGIGINSISAITDTSVPVDGGGDWEERMSFSLTVNYLSKKSKVVNTIESISGTISVADSNLSEDFVVTYTP